ncbi:MAG: hypothetical protein V4707_06115 [Pseudomonadota bacterium]
MLISLALALFAQAASPEPCIAVDERLHGELRYVETHHPNGQLIRSAFLHLYEPRCVDAEMGHAEGRWVQLLPEDDSEFRDIPSGSGIVIEAQEYQPPLTSWHIGDITAFEARFIGYETEERP